MRAVLYVAQYRLGAAYASPTKEQGVSRIASFLVKLDFVQRQVDILSLLSASEET